MGDNVGLPIVSLPILRFLRILNWFLSSLGDRLGQMRETGTQLGVSAEQ